MTTGNERDRRLLLDIAAATGKNLTQMAREVGVAVTTFTRIGNQKTGHRLSADTIDKLKATYPDFFGDVDEAADLPSYVEVEVLPSYAGMGGGGYGEGEPGRALLPRQLVEERLRGDPSDFILIDVRGDSMVEAGYLHGDQLLCDRRDRNPTQPGPFALFDGDTYVVKLIERIAGRRGWLRVFSANERYREYEIMEEEARILGRPVWLGRAL